MQKSVSRRLGCVLAHGGEDAIQHHLFFKDMKWKDLEDRKIKPPFKPKIVCTLWSFHDFSVNQFLREINFGHSRNAKSAFLTQLEAVKVDFL